MVIIYAAECKKIYLTIIYTCLLIVPFGFVAAGGCLQPPPKSSSLFPLEAAARHGENKESPELRLSEGSVYR
jgi:hypothetical protein